MGCFLPYLSKMLADRGLTDQEIGYVLGGYGLAVFISPWLMTALADLGVGTRRLLMACFLVSGGFGLWLGVAQGLPALYAAHLLMSLAWVPVVPLQDSLFFGAQARAGDSTPPYTRVRVWGTVGFVVASLALWATLVFGGERVNLASITVVGAVAALLGAINTIALPDDRKTKQAVSDDEQSTVNRLPTLDAIQACFKPRIAMYLLGQWLLAVAVFGFYVYQPLYLSKTIGFEDQWLGLIVAAGVTFEIGWVLVLNRLLDRLGERTVIVCGALLVAIRLLLLAMFPNPAVALLTQLIHGPMVLVMHVCPVIVLNRHAPDRARGSIQGVYATLVLGTARLIGLVAAGHVAASFAYTGVMGAGAFLSLLATVIFALAITRPSKVPAHDHRA